MFSRLLLLLIDDDAVFAWCLVGLHGTSFKKYLNGSIGEREIQLNQICSATLTPRSCQLNYEPNPVFSRFALILLSFHLCFYGVALYLN